MLEEQIEQIVKSPKIVIGPDPVLNKECEPVEWSFIYTSLADSMIDTMRRNNGIGLAAPQINLPVQFLVAEVENQVIYLGNPEIIETSEETWWMEEGCLSYPGVFVPVERPSEIIVKGLIAKDYYNQYTLNGMMARVIQHEMEHLKGISHISYLSRPERRRVLSQLKKKKKNEHVQSNNNTRR